jgi:hypothetical protein
VIINRFMQSKTIILTSLFFIILLFGLYFFVNNKDSVVELRSVKQSAFIDYPSEYNFRQTRNDCGPYNTAAVVRAFLKTNVSSTEFSKNISWRLPNNYTLPWGLEKQLRENIISIEIPNVKKMSDKDKIVLLQERLSRGRAIIILGGRENYQHYISIFGFDSAHDQLYIYDSLFKRGENGSTMDDNGELPGNVTYSSQELLDFWRAGGMYGFYTWYAIIAGK